MLVYVDINDGYKCYLEDNGSMLPVETSFFDGKCRTYIEGFRCVPIGYTWVREDGMEFSGVNVPWVDSGTLIVAQQEYEHEQYYLLLAENADMQSALELLGVTTEDEQMV